MKLCLGIITWNEEEKLKELLKIVGKSFDGIFIRAERTANFGESRNKVIQMAESAGYDWMLMLDSDEKMFPKDIEYLRTEMSQKGTAVMLPRYEFGPTPEFYDPTGYPDYQARFFKLNEGYLYRNPVHEILYREGGKEPLSEIGGLVSAPTTHIFHYGRCADLNHIAFKNLNYTKIKEGQPLLDEIPDGTDFDAVTFFKNVVKFEGEQPK